MPRMKIHGAESPLYKLFTDDYAFVIPAYQRPYTWGPEQAVQLVDDLLHTIGEAEDAKPAELPPYFLGSLVLIKKEDSPRAEIVDGQQRLTTITVLLSVLRDSVDDQKLATELAGYIYTEGQVTRGTETHYRLAVREREYEFFRDYIQTRGGIAKLRELSESKVAGDGAKRYRNAALAIDKKIRDLPQQRQRQLALFLLQNCIVVVVTTSDLDSAFSIFSVLNDRGVNLSATDILKADIIGKINGEEAQAEAAQKWESIEDRLGRDGFQELFSHIRMIYRRTMISSLIVEFRQYILEEHTPSDFVNVVLDKYAEAFATARDASYESQHHAERVNHALRWLNLIDNVDWFPPAIVAIDTWQDDPKKLLEFLIKLERLAAVMLLLRHNRTQRSKRYATLLKEMVEEGLDSESLEFSQSERVQALELLRGPLYDYPGRVPMYILTRLDELLSDGGAEYDRKIVSIEHVLPQRPQLDGPWIKTFPEDDERAELVHTVGNLVLLTRRKNSSAGNWEFSKKKDKYFCSDSGVSPFAITTAVLQNDEWTPSIIRQRTDEYVQRLATEWCLD